jgi:hypothetical protein
LHGLARARDIETEDAMPRSQNPAPHPKRTGRTVQRREEAPEPRLPHELDESADQQGQQPSPVAEQAKADVDRGLVDTDRGPELERAYRRQKSRP